jgi:hypothetical protein
MTFSNANLFLPQESDYFTDRGEFRVDAEGTPTLLNSLMYKLSYYKFGEFKVSWTLLGVICGGILSPNVSLWPLVADGLP